MNTVPKDIHPYLAWLACLNAVHNKVRREGYLAIEQDIQDPEDTASLFRQFPHVSRQPYLDFATDTLSLLLAGMNEIDDLETYAQRAIANLTRERWVNRADEKLLRLIWWVLWAMVRGHPPSVAAEFGRQCLPARIKPTRDELHDWLRQVDRELNQDLAAKTQDEGGMEERLDRFMASIE